MDRRDFLGAGAITLATFAAPRLLAAEKCGSQTVDDNYGIGPFHVANAPRRFKLASDFEPGQRIVVSGTVSNCSGPVAGVNLDVWHATSSACYKYPGENCPDIPGHPDDFRLRGQLSTDAQGKYSFETIKPGSYLNGSAYRPSHIHVIFTSPTIKDLKIITQLYFQGDPYIKGDAGADDPNAANRTIPLVQNGQAPWQGAWNVNIPGGSSTALHPFSDPASESFDVLLQRRGDFFLVHLPPNRDRQPVEMRLFTAAGVMLKRSLYTVTPMELDVSLLPRGAYIIDLGWWTSHGLRTESVPFRI